MGLDAGGVEGVHWRVIVRCWVFGIVGWGLHGRAGFGRYAVERRCDIDK